MRDYIKAAQVTCGLNIFAIFVYQLTDSIGKRVLHRLKGSKAALLGGDNVESAAVTALNVANVVNSFVIESNAEDAGGVDFGDFRLLN